VVLAEPWAIFVKALCIASGITALAGPRPGSLSAILPPALVMVWNLTLVLGAALSLVGLLRVHLRLEVAGLIWLGTASLVYAVAIALRFGLSGVVAAAIVAAFALAAFTRCLALYAALALARRATGP
jgi:hypothetical protein